MIHRHGVRFTSEERGVVKGGIVHDKKSVGHSRTAAHHHDHDKCAEGERKNNQTREDSKLGPAGF